MGGIDDSLAVGKTRNQSTNGKSKLLPTKKNLTNSGSPFINSVTNFSLVCENTFFYTFSGIKSQKAS